LGLEGSLHREAKWFIKQVKAEYPEFFSGKKVLDVGSLEIDGGAREFFTDCDYIGIDLGEGPGVDKICHVTDFPGRKVYDVVICTEALEHDQFWRDSLQAMDELLKPGGLLLITCAAPNRWEHGTTDHDAFASPFTTDHYRNISVEDFASILSPNLFSKSYLGYRGDMEDLYFAGIKQVGDSAPKREWYMERNHFKVAAAKPVPTVTVEISTIGRYFTTLPATIASIATQTHKPERFVLYDDGEQKELRDISPYRELFLLLEQVGIEIETFTTPRLGLATNRQHALENAKTTFLLRCDDDHVLEPDCIEKMLKVMEDETVGAVAPLVHHPGNVHPLPSDVKGKVSDIFNGTNLQWHDLNGSGPREVEHLYSCYLYRVEAGRKAGGYPKLSPVSFREDSWFSMKLKRAGYRLIVDPSIKVWHLQQSTGGVRSFTDGSLWAQDDAAFREWLVSIDVEDKSPKLICLDMGIGDMFCFRGILPTLKERFKERGMVIAIAHEGILEDEGIPLISIAEARQRLGSRWDDFQLYHRLWRVRNEKPLSEAMLDFWR
jgi:GT2 family glycosyltransferase